MKVQHGEEVANHSDPESCGAHREVCVEALTGETGRPAIEPRNDQFGMPTLLSEAEGNTVHGVNRKPCPDPARSETLCMSGSLSYGSSEISSVSSANGLDGAGKVVDHNPVVNADEKSDTPIVPQKLPNKGDDPAEAMEGRGVIGGNAFETPACRTQSRIKHASMGIEGVREAAKRDPKMRFTALMHHITPTLLVKSFHALRKQAASGVDGVTWYDYEKTLEGRVHELHREIQSGAYRAQPSRRVYIPKDDGRLRPLGIAALEEKVVQMAVTTVLNAIYEQDFLGFSYGFRQGRGQHDALDALWVGIDKRKINWILDADIRSFYDEIDHEWMLRFLSHRVGDRRLIRLIHKWLKAGTIEDGRRVASTRGTPQGSVISPVLSNIYLHYALDLWVQQWRTRNAKGDVIIVRYADDSVIGFQYEGEAQRFLQALRERLAQFGLQLHPEKTRLIRFGRYAARNCRERGIRKPETFDFLGFTHCCGRRRNDGGFKIVRLTIKKRMRTTLEAIRGTLMRRRHEPVAVVGRWLRQVLQGYLNYHAVPDNLRRLGGFRWEVGRAWRHALMRRSQRHRLSWERFQRLLRKYLPPCRLMHPHPDARLTVTTSDRSRMR
ncbi:group II intron reverse transcriptase/maturase [Sinorhizobium meliloti]|uniref:group II intron reverse transcriptase/maturase n=2 Tax=Rhizobium meliloti TaxID=382 RepID=UPI000B4A3F97|nr:group II intron reverse transcriptase/maturase [Sinorhizobium meliloti]ASP95387.1 group II intron reverse transcriptase/maturase [Sinorhizobium meliloti]MQX60939.1 group II intron reverse transcriptase/maturase [Sinorhizobium meliloti]QGJ79205.1 group II intron reverse transcriptase/maturase [Sinorhizobium meliloti]